MARRPRAPKPDAFGTPPSQDGGSARAPRLPGGSPRSASSPGAARSTGGARTSGSQVIPPAVANRMARRIAIATGIPTLLGMGVFIASYLLVSRGILEIQPVVTLAASGACFLLGLVGLSYGVLASSWEDAPGSLLGFEQIGLNIARIRASIRAMQQGAGGG